MSTASFVKLCVLVGIMSILVASGRTKWFFPPEPEPQYPTDSAIDAVALKETGGGTVIMRFNTCAQGMVTVMICPEEKENALTLVRVNCRDSRGLIVWDSWKFTGDSTSHRIVCHPPPAVH